MWVQFAVPQNNYNGNIRSLLTDHHNKYNNDEKLWNIAELPKRALESWSEQMRLEKWH